VELGHARLAIVDLETGAQPLASPCGAVHAVVNGELYGFVEQRAELEARGHRFATRSDSEVAIHLYEEHDLAFTQHLRGEFAIVLWDARRERLVAVRDRFGIKPLYYGTRPDGALVLASEVKALFAAGVPAVWDLRCGTRRPSTT
jgi:asparagine synthase (glutamine-hydrolysing)